MLALAPSRRRTLHHELEGVVSMSNGYLIAAAADLEAAHAIGEGFGLDVIDMRDVIDRDTTAAALAQAPNLGIVISAASAHDEAFAAMLHLLAQRLQNAQLISLEGDPRAVFAFLPPAWPTMSYEEAARRANIRRGGEPPAREPDRAHPLPPPPPQEPPPAPPPVVDAQPEPEPEPPPAPESEPQPEAPTEDAPAPVEDDVLLGDSDESASDVETPTTERDDDLPAIDETPQDDTAREAPGSEDSFGGGVSAEVQRKRAEPPRQEPPAPPAAEEPAPPPLTAEPPPAPQAPSPARRSEGVSVAARASAPADATAFAPAKLRRGTPELVRIVIHQPKDLHDVIKAARKLDPRTEPAPQGMNVGDIPLGSSIGISLEVKGAACDGALQRRVWQGEPIDFSYAVEADADVKQVVFLARVFVDDAQIGVLAFMRKATGPAKKPASPGDRVRLKRHKRVFISYSSKDRETVAAIATAYQAAGVEHFFDRTSLKSGEEWSPRLRREIDRADLFHLCWSRQAAESEWVAKEAEHALTRRRKAGKPEITVQMLDGPPWAKHPDTLDAINFDDFVRAAIVGYARGDGSN